MKKIPEFLDELLEKEYGKELKNKIIEGYSKRRVVTLRVNTIKSNCSKVKEVLDNLEISENKEYILFLEYCLWFIVFTHVL